MVHVFETVTLSAGPDEVWAVVGDFNGLSNWHPAIANSNIRDGATADQVGAIRELALENGASVVETQTDRSEDGRTYTYDFVESPFPITNYLATVRVRRGAEEGQSVVEWESNFDTPPEAETEMKEAISGVYTSGFGALKERFG